MATTTNYSWSTPDDTALVKDGAAAIRSLGTAIDTTVFTNAGAAIAKTLIDAEGDLIVGDAADAVQRLALGSNAQVLTVDTAVDGKIKWATPAAGGKVLQVVSATTSTSTTISSTSYTDTTITATITPTLASSTILVLVSAPIITNRNAAGTPHGSTLLLRGATGILEYPEFSFVTAYASSTDTAYNTMYSANYLDSPATTSATTYKVQAKIDTTANSASIRFQYLSNVSQIILMEIGA
jgi:hypothetical protein